MRGLRDRAAAWWSAWQFVVYISLGLLLSLAANVWQWKRAITAPLRAENKAQAEALGTIRVLAKRRTRDDIELVGDLEKIVERGRTTRTVYLKAAKATPLPQQCAPGQARIDAVNQGLSGHTGEAK